MEVKEFKSRAERMLLRFDELKSDRYSDVGSPKLFLKDIYCGFGDLERDFVHLLFAFDKEIPLFKEVSSFIDKTDGKYIFDEAEQDKLMTKFRYFITFFISYLEDYCG